LQSAIDSNAALEAVLKRLFSYFEVGFSQRLGLSDVQVRRPQVLGSLLSQLDCLPNPEQCVLVTGSKGKGTTARLIAWGLQLQGMRTGLVVSPEERHHLDRIRIDNRAITQTDFVRIAQHLLPMFDQLAQTIPAPYYHSPSDLFLVIALMWFKEQGVRYVVLEGGRGARHDLISQINAQVSCVTSVLLEHTAYLGADLLSIAQDKFSVASHSKAVLIPKNLSDLLAQCQFAPEQIKKISLVDPMPASASAPQWFNEACSMAALALQHLKANPSDSVDVFNAVERAAQYGSPSFQIKTFGRSSLTEAQGSQSQWVLDAAINAKSIDPQFLQLCMGQSFTPKSRAVLFGLTDDKDVDGLLDRFKGFGPIYAFQVTSDSGHFKSQWIQAKMAQGQPIADLGLVNVNHDISPDLLKKLNALAQQHDTIYVVGVQLFLRALRLSFHWDQVGP
jgi:folylpolyglutamate synthase/dihydropteroate synthase